MNKRHAKPTTAQMLNRIYRKVIALEKQGLEIAADQYMGRMKIFRDLESKLDALTSGQHMLSERLETIREGGMATVKTLADHCSRLLREKEILMKLQALRDSEAYMSHPLKKWQAPPRDFDTATMKAVVRERFPLDCSVKHLHRLGIPCALCTWVGSWSGITQETDAAIREFIDDPN